MNQQLSIDDVIIPARTAIQTFRDSGYKSTAAALAELIDNSIEADAKDIQILTFEEQVLLKKRRVHQIQEIAVYDDGIGMPPDVLKICLQFGNGTRLASRKGIGRFGIGLPNASVSQARRVDVYSWQNGTTFHTYLDVDEVTDGTQRVVSLVREASLPDRYLEAIQGGIGSTGSLIVWSRCDRLDLTRSKTLYDRLDNELCRIYRHFLDDDDSYGKRRNIRLVSHGREESCRSLRANDPLYIMTPNSVPGFEDRATNVMHGAVIREEFEYGDEGKRAPVEIRFTMALPETQELGGNSKVGQHYKRNTGISLVRAGREIDFGSFGFFNEQEERERWWGCEIRFEPVLDELFGVTNNKQSARGFSYLDPKDFKDSAEDAWEDQLESDPRLKLRFRISQIFISTHKTLMETIKSRGSGKRGDTPKERATADKSVKIANEALQGSRVPTRSAQAGAEKTKGELQQEWTRELQKSEPQLSQEQAAQLAIVKAHSVMEKEFGSWPGAQFFTVETVGATSLVRYNRTHDFFTDVYEPLMDLPDDRYFIAVDLLVMSFARMEEELYDRLDDIDEIRDVWGRHLKQFLRRLSKEA